MNDKKRIVITGIGPLSSIGFGREDVWKNLLNKKTNIALEECSIDGEVWAKYYRHKIDNFDVYKFGIDKDALDGIKEWKEGEQSRDLDYLITAVKLAVDDSGIDYENNSEGLGLVLTHENIGLMPLVLKTCDISYDMLIDRKKTDIKKKDYFEKIYRTMLKSGYDAQGFVNLYHVAKVFNIHDYSLFINNACASGLYAIEAASQAIKNDQAKTVVVAASDFPDIYKYIWFKDIGIYSPDGVIRPFSKDANGLAFGDGGAALVLEDLEHAKKRKAPIYAEYLGGGFDLEGWKVTVPQIGSSSYQNTIKKCFDHSGINKDDVDLLVPHGVGSKPIDYYEAKAITDTFGASPKKPFITTFKPYVGHNLGNSALIETLLLLLSLKNGIIPPAFHTESTDPRYNISLVKEKTAAKINTAVKITSAFAGFNAAVAFQKYE